MIKVGFDVDGVVLDWNYDYLEELNNAAGTQIIAGPDTFCEWNWPEKFFSRDVCKQVKDKVYHRDNVQWWAGLSALATEEQFDRLHALHQHPEYEVYFVTHCPEDARQARGLALDAFMGTLMSPQSICLATRHKGHMAYALGLDVMVDDKPENLLDVRYHCKQGCAPLLIDQPWNKSFSHPYIKRVTLDEALDYVEGLHGNV